MRHNTRIVNVLLLLLSSPQTRGFVPSLSQHNAFTSHSPTPTSIPSSSSSSALNVWWFGGTESTTTETGDSCELVAVRIERTSPNSRRIAGDIIIQKPMEDVWAILTDYDNLAIHVPNLVESTRVNPGAGISSRGSSGEQGDGSYQCRLYQRGAQKIVGFEFGASVTLDMTETVRNVNGEERRILFKCVESPFFSEFDGEWKVSSTTDPDDPTQRVSKVEYVVDVRPRGPVPVQALEWRIREDVPTNLRGVKAASFDLGKEGVLALRDNQRQARNGMVATPQRIATPSLSSTSIPMSSAQQSMRRTANVTSGRIARVANTTRQNVGNLMSKAANNVANATASPKPKLAPVRVDWYDDETMGAYLNRRNK